ncbi:MAG TPA: DUF2834 domain-containing protein [Chthoniobacterales bacterium]|jgi:hypothetical protein|nr:DUF2834 domain-containing protein [Chthoniobacterales bacterium]
MKIRHWYLLFCVLGVALPYWQFVPWVIAHGGLDIPSFVRDLFANRVSGFFGMDVLVSAIVLFVFVGIEGRRVGIRFRWLPVFAVLLVGVSFGLPLFLYLRQARLDRATA